MRKASEEMSANEIITTMQMLENPEQRKVLMGFFKTGKDCKTEILL